jgi:tetratricopeptide (TPR) repeat protein
MHEVESEMEHRLVRKCLSDAEELERHGRLVDALSLYQRAHACHHVSLSRENHMQLQGKIQALTNRMNDARILRTKGENQEAQGRVADAIRSYKQSLELVSDKTLEEHVAILEGELAKAKDEGATSSGPTKEEYVQALKDKHARAQALHEDAVKFREETFARKTRR